MEPNNSILFNLSKSFSAAEQLISLQDMIPARDTSARPSNQIWLLFMLECPLHTGKYFYASKLFLIISILQEASLKLLLHLSTGLQHTGLTPL